MIILAWMLITSAYRKIKRHFIQFKSITALFANYKHVGLCPTWNEDKSVSLTLRADILCVTSFQGGPPADRSTIPNH